MWLFKVTISLCAILAWIISYPSTAKSQTVEEKLCVASAAQNLPNIPGLSITASRTTAGATDTEAAKTLVGSFRGDLLKLAELLEAQFHIYVDLRLLAQWQKIDPIDARQMLVEKLVPKIKNTFLVEIDVRAAAQPMTFTFICAWGEGTSPFVVSLGVSR